MEGRFGVWFEMIYFLITFCVAISYVFLYIVGTEFAN